MLDLLISPVSNLVGKFLDKFVGDKDLKTKLKAEFAMEAQSLISQELKGSIDIIVAEAQSGSWLAANWRPLTMLTFVGMVVSWWFGFTPDRATPELMLELFSLIKVGLGGYVIGRSGEKIAKAWNK